jgi:hypothetical protein
MSHSKQRISIPLNDETHQALRRLAAASNSSIGATAGGYLDGMAKNFNHLAEIYELAKVDPVKAVALVQQIGNQAKGDFDSAQLELIDATKGKAND